MRDIKVLVTGGTGFIGSTLVARLAEEPLFKVVASLRGGKSLTTPGVETVVVGDVAATTDWTSALVNVDVVVHTAAVAHVRNVTAGEQLALLRLTNVEGALNLGRQALAVGVRRFVFISSIGVNGTAATHQPFTEASPADPQAAYAVSKLDAEKALRALFAGTTVELVVIRPPLVYAAHAPGNFRRLLQIVDRGLPLPFSGLANQRSIVALENLVDLIRCCIVHPAAANELFLVAEDVAVSTADIVRYLGEGLGTRTRLFAFPRPLIALAFRALGQGGIYTQLFESLAIDASKAQHVLGWQPVIGTAAGLVQAGRSYKRMRSTEKNR